MRGDFPVLQELRLLVPSAGGVGSIPDQETKITHTEWPKRKTKRKTDVERDNSVSRMSFLTRNKYSNSCLCHQR